MSVIGFKKILCPKLHSSLAIVDVFSKDSAHVPGLMKILKTRQCKCFEEMRRDTNISSLAPGFAGERGEKDSRIQSMRQSLTFSSPHPDPLSPFQNMRISSFYQSSPEMFPKQTFASSRVWTAIANAICRELL